MNVNLLKVRKVILNDRWRRPYKPDQAAIKKITSHLPECNIFGFGFDPNLGFWVVLVEDNSFTDNPDETVFRTIAINDLGLIPQNVIKLLPKK